MSLFSVVLLTRKIRRRLRRRFARRITKKDIVAGLKGLGIREGELVLVHSSLSSIGNVEGGPDTIIDAFLEVLGQEGTLMMPALFWIGTIDQTLESLKVFNPKTTPTTVGAIPKAFHRRRGVRRSIHPTHSVCAIGRLARWITENHEKCDTTFGQGTPWHKLLEAEGTIMGLGVGLGPVTFYHVIEDLVNDFPLDVYNDEDYLVHAINNEGQTIEMRIRVHNPEVAKTRLEKRKGTWFRNYFWKLLASRGILKSGVVGNAQSWIMNARDLFNTQKELLRYSITIYTTKEEGIKRGALSLLEST